MAPEPIAPDPADRAPTSRLVRRSLCVLSALLLLSACAEEPREPEPADKEMLAELQRFYEGARDSVPTDEALAELRRLYDEARARAPEDPIGWAREDLKRVGDWEYKIVTVLESATATVEDQLNEYGEERWEAYWVQPEPDGLRVYLKRPARSYLRTVPFSELGRVFGGGSAGE